MANMELLNAYRKCLDAEDWNVTSEGFHDGHKYLELQKYSPAGEDFLMTIWIGFGEKFSDAVQDYADDFDVDEHVELWINSRGKGGCPNSIQELVDDARAIREMIQDLADELKKVEVRFA